MNICLYEDSGFKTLLPLVYHRPVYDLICGTRTIGERAIELLAPDQVIFHSRHFLRKRMQELKKGPAVNSIDNKENILFVNGRLLLDKNSAKELKELMPGQALFKDKTMLGACLTSSRAKELVELDVIDKNSFADLESRESDAVEVSFLWELIHMNGKYITDDLTNQSTGALKETKLPDNCHKIGNHPLLSADDVKLYPGSIFDTSKGPIGLASGVTIKANSVLEGPLYIGKKSTVNSMTRIGDATISDVCKVGGEIHSTIMHAFSNKQHDGFLGDAYLGSWVNLGAGTNNSNLKNDYGPIQVLINGERYNSGSQFVGLLMGDHSKSGIGSLFNTGTVIGTNCNIFGGGLPPQELPSFTWGSAFKRFTTYRLDKALRVAEIVMGRREQKLTSGEKAIFDYVYSESEAARKKL